MYALTGFTSKVAVVTGAGRMRSIGRSIAIELARAGADLVPVGTRRSPETFPDDEKAAHWRDVDSVAEEIRALGRKALPSRADISDEEAVLKLRQEVVATFGRVDILVNNASVAIGEDRPRVTALDAAAWRRLFDVNLTGSFLMSKYFAQQMVVGGRGGSIVNICSVGGKTFPPKASAYAGSKAGLQALTGSMAYELAANEVRVNAVLPGLVDTSRLDGEGRGAEWRARIDQGVPLGRAGDPREVAGLVVFVCSDQGSWITGQHHIVDGGRAVGRSGGRAVERSDTEMTIIEPVA